MFKHCHTHPATELLEERQKKQRTRQLRFSSPCKDHKELCDKWQGKRIPLDKSCFRAGLAGGQGQAECAGASPLGALVDVALAVGALEARRALAGVAVDVVGAGAPVPARLAQTLVGVRLTFVPMKARQADAREGVDPIHARGSVLAGV